MDVFIFVFGVLVTISAGTAIGTIWWAAIGDGRTNAEMRRRDDGDVADPPLRRAA